MLQPASDQVGTSDIIQPSSNKSTERNTVLASVMGSFCSNKSDSADFTHDPSLLECAFSAKFYAQVDAEHEAVTEVIESGGVKTPSVMPGGAHQNIK